MTSATPPSGARYAVNRVIFDLARDPDPRARLADKAAFLARYDLDQEARAALLGPDWARLLALGALPNLVYRYYAMHGGAPESFPAAVAAQRRRG